MKIVTVIPTLAEFTEARDDLMESISEAMNVPARILFGQTEGTTADEEALARYYRREARFLQQSAWRSSPLCRYGTRWRGVKIKKTFVPRYRNVLVGVGR